MRVVKGNNLRTLKYRRPDSVQLLGCCWPHYQRNYASSIFFRLPLRVWFLPSIMERDRWKWPAIKALSLHSPLSALLSTVSLSLIFHLSVIFKSLLLFLPSTSTPPPLPQTGKFIVSFFHFCSHFSFSFLYPEILWGIRRLIWECIFNNRIISSVI